MTYCVGMRLNKGLVFMSDTRTNAGVDDIAQVRKMRSWHVPGERVITLMSAGNLATTQAVVSLLDERTKAPEDRHPSILEAPSMFQIATIVGETLRQIVMRHSAEGPGSWSPPWGPAGGRPWLWCCAPTLAANRPRSKRGLRSVAA